MQYLLQILHLSFHVQGQVQAPWSVLLRNKMGERFASVSEDGYQSHCDICHMAYYVTPISGKIDPKTRYFGWKIASLS